MIVEVLILPTLAMLVMLPVGVYALMRLRPRRGY